MTPRHLVRSFVAVLGIGLTCFGLASPAAAQFDAFRWTGSGDWSVFGDELKLVAGAYTYDMSYAEMIAPEAGTFEFDVSVSWHDTEGGYGCWECYKLDVTAGYCSGVVAEKVELSDCPYDSWSGHWSIDVEKGECWRLKSEDVSLDTFCLGTATFTNLVFTPASFHLSGPTPGVAGVANTFDIDHATPKGLVGLAFGLTPGPSRSGATCPGSMLDLIDPNPFGFGLANPTGSVSFSGVVPVSLAGTTVYFQAVDIASCQTSDLLEHKFPGNLEDLTDWSVEHHTSGGFWNLEGDHEAVSWITAAASLSVMYSAEEVADQRILARLRVDDAGDDDHVGFVLGFQPGDLSSPAADYLLLDWKKSDQTVSCQGTAVEGMALSQVSGPGMVCSSGSIDFWEHSGDVVELARATSLGSSGWEDHMEYAFEIEYTASRVRIFVDGNLEFDLPGSFAPGRFGFYDFSQTAAHYYAVQFEPLAP